MRYGLLGPLEMVGDDGQWVAMSGDREPVLVACAAAGGEPGGADLSAYRRLVGDQPPSTAGNALQVHVSRLRKKLAAGSAGGDLLRRESSGYRLTVAAGELDMATVRGPRRTGQPSRALRSSAPRRCASGHSRPYGTAAPPLTARPPADTWAAGSRSQSSRLSRPQPRSSGPAFRRLQISRSFAAQDPKILPGDRNFLLDSNRSVRDAARGRATPARARRR